MNILDYGIAATFGLSIIFGLLRGFIKEAISLITWGSAMTLAVLYTERLSNQFTFINMVGVRLLLSFLIIVLINLVIGGILSHFGTKLIKYTGFSGSDKILGMLFGILRAILIVTLVVVMLSSKLGSANLLISSTVQQSELAHYFLPFGNLVKGRLPPELVNRLEL